MFLDQGEGFQAVLALGDDVHLGEALQQEREFVARGAFVVHDDCIACGTWGGLRRVYAARDRRGNDSAGRGDLRVSVMEIAELLRGEDRVPRKKCGAGISSKAFSQPMFLTCGAKG